MDKKSKPVFGNPPIPSLEIKTECTYPSIPARIMDWFAWEEGQEEDGVYGKGPTEEAAIQDLRDQLDDI